MNSDAQARAAPAAAPIGGSEHWAALGGVGVAYFVLAAFAITLPIQSRGALPIWPADGLAMGVLLLVPAGRWGPWLGVIFLASIGVHAQVGAGTMWQHMLAGAAIDVLKPAAMALFLRRLAGQDVRIDSLRSLAAFFVGLIPIAGVTALLEASVSYARLGVTFRDAWSISFLSDFVGAALFVPLVLAWKRDGMRSAIEQMRGRVPELVFLFAGLVVTVHAVFGTRPQVSPFLPALAYLCAPFLIWAALRFGMRSTTLGLCILALLGYYHTAAGTGPFAVQETIGWPAFLNLQAYLATVVASTLFAAALVVERAHAAESTEAWRNRYEAVIRASENLLYELDPAAGTLLWDGDTGKVLGIAPDSVTALKGWMERVHPEDLPRLRGLRSAFLSGETTRVALEYRVRRDNGEYVPLGVNGFSIRDVDPEGQPRLRVIGYVTDIAERQKAEAERQRLAAQLKQAEKMEAVGRLAGGIAHDFNNILGAILGYGELAQQRAADEAMKRYLDTIMNAGNRAKLLVAQILAFSRAEGGTKSPVAAAALIREVSELVRGALTQPIEVRLALEAEDAVVSADSTRLHQLLMNLCTNASHAMPEGGVLEIGLHAETVREPRQVRSGEMGPGEYVRIEVRDSGAGMAPAVMDRLFEPFFTTKPAGKGTGLGLALVHSVVVEHLGFIDVESEPGRGSTFRIWLPRIEAPAERQGAPATEAAARGEGQVVLAVDDEPEVLSAMEEMLASLGYEPVGFTDSREALEAFRSDPGRFDAMISDEVMPAMTGTQLAAEVRRVNPALPIVIATGFGGEGFEARAQAAGINRVLRKPCRMSEIGEALSRLPMAR